MAYKVVINTSSYRDRRCSKSNWEPGTMNDFMHAIDGWTVRENNLQELGWRLNFFAGNSTLGVDENTWPLYQEWEKKHQKKNYVKFYDRMCEFDRKDQVRVYGYAQGYVNMGVKILQLRKEGKVRIYFKEFYDMRQYYKNMDGCYIEVTKV